MMCAELRQLLHLGYCPGLHQPLTRCLQNARLQRQLLQLLMPHQQQLLRLLSRVNSQQQVSCC
jgi:hypothetical protein